MKLTFWPATGAGDFMERGGAPPLLRFVARLKW